jgi:O-antigen/teichoic acid export membrane protein
VLNTLGAEDYGIYNVVAGVVTMFGFISGAMATASQRYFSFELGRGDYDSLKKIFGLSLFIYVLIGIIILLLAETIGLWFVNDKLVIPVERKNTALWVYQFSVLSFLFTIMTSPYMAIIIAHEDMNIYAYVSIADVVIKLGMVFLLSLIRWDKLALYGFLILIVSIIHLSIYWVICTKKYKECKFSFHWNHDLFKEIASYTGWSMFGASVGIVKNQIVNILLNQYFNPVVVAARSIAATVNSASTSFSQNFNTAMRPQIVKSYAAGEKETMLSLMFRGSKGTYLLMYLFVLPLVLEMPMILGLWLKNPPEYAVLFTRLVLFDVLIDSISYPIMAAIHATGKIRMYQAVVGGILLLNAPVSWMVLHMGAPPYSVMILAIIISLIAIISRSLILKRLVNYSLRQFLRMVLAPVFIVSVVSAVLPVILCNAMMQNIVRLCLVTGLSIISVCISSYFIALNNEEQKKIKSVITMYIYASRDKKIETIL